MRLPRFEPRIYMRLTIQTQDMGSRSTEVTTTLCRPVELTDKYNQYMLKL